MATETLRPNAAGDAAAQAVTGTSNWAALSDGSDTTYVRNNGGTLLEDDLNLGASALTNEVITSIDVRFRARSETTAAGQVTVGVRLSGTNSLAATQTAIPTTATDYTKTSIARPGGGSWTVADLANLQVVVQSNDTTAAAVRVFEVFVDVNVVVVTNILSNTSAVGGSSYATASWTPIANRLYLASVTTRTGITADPTIPTASGNGLTWVAIDSVVYDDSSSSRRRVTLFRAMGASPTTGALTFDEAGQAQTDAGWSIEEVTGMDTSGTNGSGAIVQSATAVDVIGRSTALVITLAAFGSANNSAYGVFGYTTAGGAITIGSGFTQLADKVLGASSTRLTTEWRPTSDTTVDLTPDGVMQIGGIAVEIKAAVSGATPVSITKSMKYVIVLAPSAKTKSLKYVVRITPSAATKSLTYRIRKTASALTKSLKYTVEAPAAVTKSLKYTTKISVAAITKSLKYVVKAPASITKSLKYVVKTTPAAITKSLRYLVKAGVPKTKSLKYDIVATASVSITKSLKYAVKTPVSAITKSLKYAVVKTPSALTKSLRYAVKAPVAITKSLKYTVKASHAAITKSLKYALILAPVSITKSLRYAVKPSVAKTKSLKYTVKAAAGAVMKSLKYTVIKTPSALTKSLKYTVVRTITAITKSVRYSVRAATSYYVPTATGDDYNQWTNPTQAYVDDGTTTFADVINKKQDYYTFGFSLPAAGTVTGIEVKINARGSLFNDTAVGVELSWDGGASYTSAAKFFTTIGGSGDADYLLGGATDVWGHSWTFAELANANFRLRINANSIDADVTRSTFVDFIQVRVHYIALVTTVVGITRALRYIVKAPVVMTKSLKYTVKVPVAAITKALHYRVKTVPTAITKSLRYIAAQRITITKSLKYTVRTSHAAITKSLKYTLRLAPVVLTKSLRYAVRPSVALTKPLRYIVKAPAVVTKSLRYVIAGAHIKITRSLAYVLLTHILVVRQLKYYIIPRRSDEWVSQRPGENAAFTDQAPTVGGFVSSPVTTDTFGITSTTSVDHIVSSRPGEVSPIEEIDTGTISIQ